MTFTANGKQLAAACHKSLKIYVFQLVSISFEKLLDISR